ncbi:MAG: type II toxin-antitoxin system RelE/ParE family toxin [Verrucomicrobiota bacterium]
MPRTRVIFFREITGESPVVQWLEKFRKENHKEWANCRVRIEMPGQSGHELRRPAADFVREGIYELRAKQGHVQYRILYFFHGRSVAVLAHSLTKEDVLPPADIERALRRKRLFEGKPEVHTYEQDRS